MRPSSPRASAAGCVKCSIRSANTTSSPFQEYPDGETATAALLQIGFLGGVRSNTMRAFTVDQMRTIISKDG